MELSASLPEGLKDNVGANAVVWQSRKSNLIPENQRKSIYLAAAV
jgi:hypothetical protein